MASLPLVSCIMPTRNRRQFVSQAIWYFQRQEYSFKELIVVDDGEDAIADLIVDDQRIRYLRLEQRHSLGAKRNLACEMSRGDLIAHWDDDDWIAPHRLGLQVAQLLNAEADVCGICELLYYHINAGEAWLYRYEDNHRPWLAGGTLLYRRSIWANNPFLTINVGEDTAFIWQLPKARLHVIPDNSFYIGLIHSHNTAAKNLADSRWQRRSLGEVSSKLALDRDFYVRLRNGKTAEAALTNRRPPTVTVSAPFMVYDGYGSMAEYLVLGISRTGINVNIVPINLDLKGTTAEFQAIAHRRQNRVSSPVLYFCWPRPELQQFQNIDDLFINTMWESSRLPAGWAERLNQALAVIVPSKFLVDVCRHSGVTVPIEVIPEGIDPDIYYALERPERQGITTLIVGTLVKRKHTLEGIAAWKLAFADDPHARLLIKARFNYGNYTPDDPRIQLIHDSEATRGIAHWYQQADVLLALGNEGFGLPLIEGMATGLPVIALNSEGQADVCEVAGEFLLPVQPASWEESNEPPFGPAGVRGVPSVEEVANQLRWVATHRQQALAMGQAASAWVLQHRNIWAKGPAVLEVMERYRRTSTPLRWANTFWVPSWQTACGVAEYTASLSLQLPNVQVTKQVPNWAGVRLIHIQHENSLFNDSELTQYIHQARQNKVPTIVTEHSVSFEKRSWEKDADVLVSLTQKGTEILQQRSPGKKVEYIPHGCPTWFPPRKTRRDRVIAACGFLAPYKGFAKLLDVLRTLPNTELLLFSHAKSETTAAQWQQAIAGLPVRWVNQFLPAWEIAHRLAKEADLLIFWYDEVPHFSASGAVRVGLATGVPVLTSPTNWFSDIQQATYQPENLIQGVERLLEDTPLRQQLTAAAQDYCHQHSWTRIAECHLNLWKTLDKT